MKRTAQRYGQLQKENEAELFGQQGTAGIDFKKYSSITVKRSGKGSDDAKPFNDFKSLKSEIPDFMVRNISKLKFEKPTPIQKHSIPLGLKGYDLMCVAQTGSGKTGAFLVRPCYVGFSLCK